MPTVDIGVSRKIESRDERSRLRGIVASSARRTASQRHHPHAAGGRPKEDILGDLGVPQIWTGCGSATSARATALYQEQSIVGPAAGPADRGLQAIRIDHEQNAHRVLELVERIMPTWRRVKTTRSRSRSSTIFGSRGNRQGAQEQGLAEVRRLVVINQTEALVAIDVNTGRYRRQKTSAGSRVYRQDQSKRSGDRPPDPPARLSGIIVLDLIDMEDRKNR